MPDYFDYIDVPDSWTDRPLVRVMNERLCMDLNTQGYLLNAIESKVEYAVNKKRFSIMSGEKKILDAMMIYLSSLKTTIMDIPICPLEPRRRARRTAGHVAERRHVDSEG